MSNANSNPTEYEVFSSATGNRITVVGSVKSGIDRMESAKIAAWFMTDAAGHVVAERTAEKHGSIVVPAKLTVHAQVAR